MKRIKIKKHKIRTYEVNKISLSCSDDKRYILDDGVHTLAYLHKDLKKQILTSNKRVSQILIEKKSSHRFPQKRKGSKVF